MPEYRITFGSQYGSAEFGAPPHPRLGYDYAHRDGYLTVVAPDERTARSLVVTLVGTAWSNIYPAEEHAADEHLYPRGELLRLVVPSAEPDDAPVHLLLGSLPPDLQDDLPGDTLVTVWRDGTGELAYRPDPTHTWSRPCRLHPAMPPVL